jgi:hypothetical protein
MTGYGVIRRGARMGVITTLESNLISSRTEPTRAP